MNEDDHRRGGEAEEAGAERLPLDGELDLHPFPSDQVEDLVRDWLEECRREGILHVRIIHGKGIGTRRERVHRVLERLPWVRRHRLAGDRSGWGATLADLEPPEKD